MIFLRAERSSPCASAVFVSLVYVVANIVGVMADTSYTGPPLLYSLYGPGGGCVDAGFMMPGSTTAAAAVGESTICETDVLDTPDGSFDVYTKFVMTSCGTDVLEATLYNCQDSACGECDTEPETGEIPTNCLEMCAEYVCRVIDDCALVVSISLISPSTTVICVHFTLSRSMI